MPAWLIPAGVAALQTWQSGKKEKKADQYQNKMVQLAEDDYRARAPMRRQGMQALGQVEAPIDFGNTFHNASNPFSAAKGPPPSTASYGNWGQHTTSPEAIDAALGPSPAQTQGKSDMLAMMNDPSLPKALRDSLRKGAARAGIQPLGG